MVKKMFLINKILIKEINKNPVDLVMNGIIKKLSVRTGFWKIEIKVKYSRRKINKLYEMKIRGANNNSYKNDYGKIIMFE